MDQEKVKKLVEWIKTKSDYSTEQLRQAVLKGGATEEEFTAALSLIKASASTLEYKGVARRALALLLDVIFFSILLWLFMMVFGGTYIGGCNAGFHFGSTIDTANGMAFQGLCGFSAYLYFLTVFIYYILLEWKLGGTFGKLITGIRVVKATGDPLDLKASLIRNIMRIIDFLPFFYIIGAISIWSSKTKQRLGDRLAKTVVVSKKSIK